ncbi:hypothetical protein KFZ70_10960 [Tamlana fucoidanivorans]|uniref:Uncharacterized protein n=1 Tax=Allotamlana fucoidanivorans TaxID=2583814 RepID=A0A5C4SIQ2_9FLAO|nr:hypothetical protein [Tamlana fucoidanivorans]TNJ43202.1 hypothetical protein FGF67_12675 [Tamlana fucoidanivorans]
MKLKNSLIIAIVISLLGTVTWELYWRSKGVKPSIDGNDALWAVERAKVDRLSKDDFVIIGSSRVHFDIQLDIWEEKIGNKPIQLAMGGSSPLPVFHDIVHTTNFNGTILVGVTPPLFFSTTFPKADSWKRPQTNVDYFHNRTYAQRLNHQLSIPLQNSFAFISETKGIDGINLKEFISKVKIGTRAEKPREMPPFHDFSTITIDRNVRMKKRMEIDTAYANSVKHVWEFFFKSDGPLPDKKSTMAFFLKDLEKFKEKGGNVILLRCPSSDVFRELEKKITPRDTVWDDLVAKAAVKSYHFEDYPQLQNLDLPEWSHLKAEHADYFTKELIKILKQDNAIPNQ